MQPGPSQTIDPAASAANGATRNGGPRAVGRRLQELVEKAEQLPNGSARALVLECLQSLLAFYGDGLAHILQAVKESSSGNALLEKFAGDPLISGLLLIHSLHPVDLETRLRAALDKLRPYLQSHGGNVELLSLQNDFARLRLQGTCKTCPSSAVTLELAVRGALEEACPDLLGFAVDDTPAAKGPALYKDCEIGTKA